MPRDIPVGNGRLLVTFDQHYQIRDLYFPHVGQENHAGGGPCRFGIYADVPGRHRSGLFWSSDEHAWQVRQRYLRDTLTTSVSLDGRELRLAVYCNDTVDFHRNILVRKIKLKNLAHHDRVAQVIHHQDFNMFGTKIGDTAYYDPELKSLVHYRGKRYLMVTFFAEPPAGSRRERRASSGSTSTPPAPAASAAPKAPGATPRTATSRATPSPRVRSIPPSPTTCASRPTAKPRCTWRSSPAIPATSCSSCTSGWSTWGRGA